VKSVKIAEIPGLDMNKRGREGRGEERERVLLVSPSSHSSGILLILLPDFH